MLPQLVDIPSYRPRAFDSADDNDKLSPITPPPSNIHLYHAKDHPQFMYNPPRSDYSPSPVDQAYYTNYSPYYPQPRRPSIYPHLDPINTSALPASALDPPDQLSPFNPNFSAPLSAAYPYSPVSPDDHYGPSPPNTGTSSASAPVTLSLSQAPAAPQSSHLVHPTSSSLGPSPTESNSKTYSFIPLPGNAVKKRPRRRYDEIERLYQCSWPDCTKAYGTLNHLNAHVTMQKHGAKRSPNEFKELRKQWRKAKKEAEQQAQQAAASAHNLAARRVASMQSLSTSGLSPLHTELRRTHTQDHLYDPRSYVASPIHATHPSDHLRNVYPSSAPSTSAGGPLAAYQNAAATSSATPPTSTHPLDSPHHYSHSHPAHPSLALLHTSIPISHHHNPTHHLTSDSRYPLGLTLVDDIRFPPTDNNNGPSSTNDSPRSTAGDASLDAFAGGRQRYPSAPSILWSSSRSTYVPSANTTAVGGYPQEGGDLSQQESISYAQQQQQDGDAAQISMNFNGMVGMNIGMIGMDGNRLPADSTLLTPLRGYEPPSLLPPLQPSSQYTQQDMGSIGNVGDLGNVGPLEGEATRPSTGHGSLESGGEEGY